MDVKSAIAKRRTIRRFQQIPVSKEVLCELVDLSRLYASGGNMQPIRFVGVLDAMKRNAVFETLRWAAYLPGFEITESQRPTAYVILTCDAKVKRNCQFDLGAAATTLMLAAEDYGLATCCLASFDRNKIVELFTMEEEEPLLVIALGYPAQESKAVEFVSDVKYYEDESGSLCVPKRSVNDLLKLY